MNFFLNSISTIIYFTVNIIKVMIKNVNFSIIKKNFNIVIFTHICMKLMVFILFENCTVTNNK